ncbi:MAG: SMI1/KNR4 family protein [Candidatus Melainabacteria bacterium]|nr:SMI1/KNR4 family protein [Candidatus Melainabacteria bacterium]
MSLLPWFNSERKIFFSGSLPLLDYTKLIPISNLRTWQKEEPASTEEIERLQQQSLNPLPLDYVEFLQFSNGAYGELPVQPYWCELFSASEVIQCNQDYEVFQQLPGFFAIGSSGGGALILIGTETDTEKVFFIPVLFDGPEDLGVVANTFLEFVLMLGQKSSD